MVKKILDIGFYLVLIYLVAITFFMAHSNKELSKEIEQLKQENEELQLDKINLEINLENALDAYWQLNNRLEHENG